jgi:hypothetical protein
MIKLGRRDGWGLWHALQGKIIAYTILVGKSKWKRKLQKFGYR